MSEWIKTSERLPAEYTDVLVCWRNSNCKTFDIFMAHLDRNDKDKLKFVEWGEGDYALSEIPYWMPLPEPPKYRIRKKK